MNYKSHPVYVQSDHKPVSAEFDIKVKWNQFLGNIFESMENYEIFGDTFFGKRKWMLKKGIHKKCCISDGFGDIMGRVEVG